jgi:hypothetical protein
MIYTLSYRILALALAGGMAMAGHGAAAQTTVPTPSPAPTPKPTASPTPAPLPNAPPTSPPVPKQKEMNPPPPPPAPKSSRPPLSNQELLDLIARLTPAAKLPPIPVVPVETKSNKSAVKKANKELRRVRQIYSEQCMARGNGNYAMGANGVQACEGVLSMPPEKSTGGLFAITYTANDNLDTKAVYHQKHAMHLYFDQKYDAALTALAASDAIGRDRKDIMFDGSTGLGNQMLRALIFHAQGKSEEALAIIAAARKLRPHALSLQMALNRIENSISPDVDRILARMDANKAQDPDATRGALSLSILLGKIDAAAKIADDVSVTNPKRIGGWAVTGDADANGRFVKDRELDLKRAYVWAAAGQKAKSDDLLGAVRAAAAAYPGPVPAPKFKGEKISKDQIAKHAARVAAADQLKAKTEKWTKAIALRAEALTKTGEQMQDALDAARITDIEAGIDVLRLLKFENPKDRMGLIVFTKQQDSELLRGFTELRQTDLAKLLPYSERLEAVPKFGAGDGLISARETGYSQAKEDGDDEYAPRTIRFGTFSGSGAQADELLLVAAANYAQKEGKDSFIMLSRQVIKRQTTVYGYYGYGGNTYDSGYEASMRAVLLNSKALPSEWADKADRLILVQTVQDEIKRKYDVIEARKAGEKAAKDAAEKAADKKKG